MPDYHQIVDQIRAFVQSSDQTRSEVLEGLASAYAEACVELNQRIGRCHRLLQQGLRSEAIQLAESEPKLLDSLAALDFPERADWDELVQMYELAAAPKLSVDPAQFLNEAYAQEDPLQDLLRMHRRLALQRAPLKSRIAVMRKLAAQDANNPIWTDDLRTFEKARFREVQVEAAQAVQSRNVTALGQLLAEIEQQIMGRAAAAGACPRTPESRRAVPGPANASPSHRSRCPAQRRVRRPRSDPGPDARQEWIALTAAAPPEPDDPIWDRVQPALVWLEDEDRRDELTTPMKRP